ncbi:MAG: AAA family ATPase, partial [Gammaproteobacteria bacterium]|nr:AAA family ATPase [Gammaproteobacteria bacterium]
MSNTNLLAQPPDYLHAYSLKCEPFANTLDGRFFYAGTALMQRLDLLIHLTQFGDSVVLVSGPDGSGKTTLLSRFAAQANKQWRLCPINADEFEQIPRLMADALRIDDAGDELEMLNRWASETDNSQLLVILIDKAEALAGPAVDLLCKLLACPVRERLRLILFGTPAAQKALKNTLDSRNLPGSSQLLEVPRLSEEETSSYLLYRLAVAGYSGESPFTATEVRGICKAAEGRPGAINLLAHDTLVERQARKSSKRVSASTGKPKFGTAAWGPLTLVIVALATYLGWQRLQPTPEPGTPTAGPGVETQPIPLAIPEPVAEPQPEPVALPPPAVASNAIAPATQPVTETTARAEPEAVSLPLPDLVTPPVDAGKKIEVETSEPVIVGTPASPAPKATQPQAAPGAISAPESQAKPPIKAVAVS